ncbi:hypothetical protein [Nocardia suismassiliense]|uniref:hypothetical protein n=1 Tax=Nocardia suismassiliense TaxID=2077092 RepID=UPI000D1E0BD8|nr:hypothetical protein [Nocardia suismassiliense]
MTNHQALQNAITTALHAQQLIRGTPLDNTVAIEGYLDIGELATTLAGQFRIIPHTDITVEYGVEYRTIVDGGIDTAEHARHRATHSYSGKAEPRQRHTWNGPWTPLPDEHDTSEETGAETGAQTITDDSWTALADIPDGVRFHAAGLPGLEFMRAHDGGYRLRHQSPTLPTVPTAWSLPPEQLQPSGPFHPVTPTTHHQ